MGQPMPARVGGYVLAGGRSSRMGRDKALLELGGRPLVARAMSKLRWICAEAKILGSDPGLEQYGNVVRDVHPDCGPMSGVEAALLDSKFDWNLILPVDVPFLPGAFLDWWVRMMAARPGARLGMFRVNEVAQPALLMIHREVLPYLTGALSRGEYKLGPVLRAAAADLAGKRGEFVGRVFMNLPIDDHFEFAGSPWAEVSEEQGRDRVRWFANLNTPEDFAEAERHLEALDP